MTNSSSNPKEGRHIIPTSFDPNDEKIDVYLEPIENKWQSCKNVLESFDINGVMLFVPIFWQIEPKLYEVCREVGAPIFVTQPENIPVGAQAINRANINTVVTTKEGAGLLSLHLNEHNLSFPKLWFLIHPINSNFEIPITVKDSQSSVAQEVHIFPGVPILEQCPLLIKQKGSRFHLSEGYILKERDGNFYVSAQENSDSNLSQSLKTFHIKKISVCDCGKDIVEKNI